MHPQLHLHAALHQRDALSPPEVVREALHELDVLRDELIEVLEDVPLAYRCTCTRERARRGVGAAGRDEILDMVARDKGAELSCEFCKTVYRFEADELLALIDELGG